ncbi:MAG: radical SAM family heme chaperone HemW [Chitinophagaceae bacterium]
MAGIYIHIPFCKQACNYCNFHFSTSLKQKEALLEALSKEITLQKDWLKGAPIDTIYFGGGTPSLLSSDELNILLEKLMETFQISNLKECTLEANPDDLTVAYLKNLRNTPVDRLSIGVQSFRDEDLQYMNRAHNAQQSEYALKAAQDNGFSNLTIDLIYGTPGLGDAAWKENIRRMGALDIPHFSAYALTVEEGTALEYAIRKKAATPVDAGQSAEQGLLLMEEAEILGYEQYEISNYCKPDCYALHNTSYWKGTPYLGLGPSAHSFNGENIRQWNVSNNALYIQSILKRTVPFESETLSREQRLNEYIMTSLRTKWGCDLDKIERDWGSAFVQEILKGAAPYIAQEKLTFQERKLTLTRSGRLFADGIASDLFF